MAHYIPKSTLIAEIEKRKIIARESAETASNNNNVPVAALWSGKENICNELLSVLDNLELKEVDLEKDVRQIISLYYEGLKHYEDIIKEEREENGGSELAIKIMDGVVNARELGIKYVIDKLKAQQGE